MADSASRDEWMKRVLGVDLDLRPRVEPPGRPMRCSPAPLLPPRPGRRATVPGAAPRGDRPITVAPVPEVETFAGDVQGRHREVRVRKSADGRVVYSAPSPPVGEITFSGGGGKGAALPGAVKALHDSGVLSEVRQVSGASVGSMTAALVAAGITGDEFTRIFNAREMTDRIVEGAGTSKLGLLGSALKNIWKIGSGVPLTGEGLEGVVCDGMNLTLGKRIGEFKASCEKNRQPLPPVIADMLPRLAGAPGPTFMDLRILSQHIPAVKEVVISGTYTSELDEVGGSAVADGNRSGLLYVFSADSEPDMPVAVAVHASASLPFAFRPLDLKLASGLTVRFIDGGVANNTPTSSSLGNKRELDGMPQERGMVFVFEDAEDDEKKNVSRNLLKGTVTPPQGRLARVIDYMVGSSYMAAEYAKDRDMSDRPEDIVVVPLKITRPKTSRKGVKTIDMRGGTIEFDLSDKDKIALQDAAEGATLAQIRRESGRERHREFASDRQMFVSIPMKDLELLVSGGYAGAADARDFRQAVAARMDDLKAALSQARSEQLVPFLLDRPEVARALDDLNRRAGGDSDFQRYVGREMNRGELDSLVDLIKRKGAGGGVADAALAVAETLAVRSGADHILKNLLYPQMKYQASPTGAGMQTIQVMEALLREAGTKAEVNQALQIGVSHFANKSDRALPRRGHKAFARQLQHQFMR